LEEYNKLEEEKLAMQTEKEQQEKSYEQEIVEKNEHITHHLNEIQYLRNNQNTNNNYVADDYNLLNFGSDNDSSYQTAECKSPDSQSQKQKSSSEKNIHNTNTEFGLGKSDAPRNNDLNLDSLHLHNNRKRSVDKQ